MLVKGGPGNTVVSHNLVNIGSGNGLMPVGIKPLPEPLLTRVSESVSGGSCQIHLRVISLNVSDTNH